ncbi:MAG: hypothetical protein U0232_02430 [Thermomicrobiales bacterium]
MILPKERDPRFITIRRGGTLTDADHHLLALWAAACAEHVLPLFAAVRPDDPRPRHAIDQARAWARGEISMTQSRTAGSHATRRARPARGQRDTPPTPPPRPRWSRTSPRTNSEPPPTPSKPPAPPQPAGSAGRGTPRVPVAARPAPAAIRALVLDDQHLRNAICWSVFDC